MSSPVNCTHAPVETPSNPGVAGIGVILGFIIPAAVSIVLAASLIIQESFINSHKPAHGQIRRKLLFAFSDQQILYGIGIQAVGLAQIGQLVPYHFFIIWMVSLLSTAVHNSTLLVLVNNFHSDKVLRWLRQFLMFVNLALGCIFGVCMLRVVQQDLESSTLPTACAWILPVDAGALANNTTLSFLGTIAVICGNVIVFAASTWWLHDRRQRGFKWLQLAGILLMTAIAVAASARVLMVSQAFGTPSTPLQDENEKQITFATIVTLLMLLLPLMTVLEIYREEAGQMNQPFELKEV